MTAYGLGARPQTFAPLLGDGILTQDSAPMEALSRNFAASILAQPWEISHTGRRAYRTLGQLHTNKQFYRPATSILPVHIPHNYVSPFRQVDELFTG